MTVLGLSTGLLTHSVRHMAVIWSMELNLSTEVDYTRDWQLRKGWPESNLRPHTHSFLDFCDRLEDGTVEGTLSELDVSPPSFHKVPGDIPMLFKRKLSSPPFCLGGNLSRSMFPHSRVSIV